jgi:hypothetical protein
MRDAVTMDERMEGGGQNYYVAHFVFTVENVSQYNEMYRIFQLHLASEFISSVNQCSSSVRSKYR